MMKTFVRVEFVADESSRSAVPGKDAPKPRTPSDPTLPRLSSSATSAKGSVDGDRSAPSVTSSGGRLRLSAVGGKAATAGYPAARARAAASSALIPEGSELERNGS